MTQIYTQKTWSAERILDVDMNRMEYACAGRVYHVFASGTKGDFTTIQEAIDKCEADGSGTVRIHGNFTLGATLTIQGHFIALIADEDASIKMSLAVSILSIGTVGTPYYNILIRGTIFDGNTFVNAGIEVEWARRLKIEGCRFFNFGNGAQHIYLKNKAHEDVWMKFNTHNGDGYHIEINSVGTTLQRIQVVGNTFIGGTQHVFYIHGTGGAKLIWICDNVFDAQGMSGANYLIYLDAGISAFHIERNEIFYPPSYGIIGPSISGTLLYGEIKDNVIIGPDDYAIYINGASNLDISHNQVKGAAQRAMQLDDLDACVVNDNLISDCQKDGIYLTTPNESIVSGNLVHNAGLLANNTYDAIVCASGTYNGVKGNHTSSTSANKHRYGVTESGTKNHVTGNSDHGAATAGSNVAGAGSQNNGNTSTV